MKKLFLLPFLLLACLLQAQAFNWTDTNGVTWTVEYKNYYYSDTYHNYYTITAATGYGDQVSVPETVYNDNTPCTIEAIGYGVFRDKKTLTAVNLPTTIKAISGYAFSGCTSLTTVGDIANCETIDGYAFSQCSALQSVDLSACQQIGYYAFSGCSSLTNIGSLVNCTNINYNAFYGCSQLKNATLGAEVAIGGYAFYGCSSLQEIDLSKAKSIGGSAFYNCSSLKSVGDLSRFENIPTSAFYNCRNLETVDLSNCRVIESEAFYSCQKLQSVDLSKCQMLGSEAFDCCYALADVGDLSLLTTIPSCAFYNTALTSVALPNVTSIGNEAFSSCSSLSSVSMPNVTSIGYRAFASCSSLTDVTITSTSLSSIGDNAFTAPGTVTLMATTPATLSSKAAFGSMVMVRVPDGALADYRAADYWKDFATRIIGIGTQINYDIAPTLNAASSGIHAEIGEECLQNVVSLKVTGDINSYDIMVMRNKMDNLHYLDLSEANIVANDYEYYTGYHTEDNILGPKSFRELSKLVSVKLPKTIKKIGNYAFYGCSNLKEIEMQPGLESIDYYAFGDCTSLKKVVLPEGLKNISFQAFQGCYALEEVAFPSTLESIDQAAFNGCALKKISLPTSMKAISQSAFMGCGSLSEVRIPSSITSIGNEAFSGCRNLNDVYTYTVEPTQINQNTFSTYATATLHVPTTSYYTYYWDTEWSQFRTLTEFDEPYEYFYINKDYTIGDDKGTIDGDPDADVNAGGGLIIETGEDNEQQIDDLNLNNDGNGNGGSVIADGNLQVNRLCFNITIRGGRWYFLSFPFPVKISNIEAPSHNYVWRYYDGEERANKGNGGWKNYLGDQLIPGTGYIFQCNKSGTLKLWVERSDNEMDWRANDHHHGMNNHTANDVQNASWNFVGNPFTCYFDCSQLGEYSAPITRWNGSSYEALRPGDDDFFLNPFEAFFVQKPGDQDELVFDQQGRYTYLQSQQQMARARKQRMEKGVNADRLIVNLTLGDGQNTDKTRVVMNNGKTTGYEMDCDAAKFISQEQVPQLWTQNQLGGVRYAINERPEGEVRLAYSATKDGELTIGAQRMDEPMLLVDTEMGITHDLAMGDYTFHTEAGTHEGRFLLRQNREATGIAQLREQTGVSIMGGSDGIYVSTNGQQVSVYSLGGTMLVSSAHDGIVSLPKATYIVKVGEKATKVMVK